MENAEKAKIFSFILAIALLFTYTVKIFNNNEIYYLELIHTFKDNLRNKNLQVIW